MFRRKLADGDCKAECCTNFSFVVGCDRLDSNCHEYASI